jgi:hypothetical protein
MSYAATVTDAAVMVKRCVRRSLRDPEAFFTALTLPVVLLLLFVYVFGGALGREGHYADYVVPGLIVLCDGFGAERPPSRSPPICPAASSTASARCRSRAPRSCSDTWSRASRAT